MEFAKETGTSATTYVYELLQAAKPQLKSIIEAIKYAKQENPADAFGVLKEMLNNAEVMLDAFKEEFAEGKLPQNDSELEKTQK